MQARCQARCQALSRARSSFYYQPRRNSEENLVLMRLLNKEFTVHQFKGCSICATTCA